jgi:hypothetical protein
MSPIPREAVWVLLSELFVDTAHTKNDLLAIGKALRETGFSAEEVEHILRREVAPVCGRWMFYPGVVGPWPMFDEQELKRMIEERLQKPWYKQPLFNTGFLFMPGVKHEWEIVRNAMRSEPDA